ncbi:MAG: adenylate/guanylate cyclase domain-containing protein [Ignavibacteria bacterium]|nr:adenylate/guanylate cyclase domain-containing protein [Ignavibacteria bacterium]
MNSLVRGKEKIRSVIYLSLPGLIVGPLFTVIVFGANPVTILKGAIIGFMITSVSSVFEIYVFQNNFKKLKFITALLIRTGFYIFIISFSVIIVWVVHESSLNNASLFETLLSSDFRFFILKGDFKNIFIFAISFSFLMNFIWQINILLGRKVLLKYISGKYHKPRLEKRMFMFIDLTSSTTIAEKLGPVEYHKFINKYFFDIDGIIVSNKADVYQYVGDEVIISWINDRGFENLNCLNCFFEMRKCIEYLSESYLNTFSIIPEFKAGLHYGEVVTGEIGDSKKEIVFHGDVLNTASRIQAQSKTLGKGLLVSDDVISKMELNGRFKKESMGKFRLRGKEQDITLYSIEPV